MKGPKESKLIATAHPPNEYYEQVVNKWAMEIGRFILAFGNIEHTTYQAMEIVPRDPIAAPLKKLLLADRIDVLLAVARSQPGEEAARFAATLNEVKTIINQRNLVAHNGVGVDVYLNPDDPDEMEFIETIRSGRDLKKHLRIEQLQGSRARAERLSRELQIAFDALRHKILAEKLS